MPARKRRRRCNWYDVYLDYMGALLPGLPQFADPLPASAVARKHKIKTGTVYAIVRKVRHLLEKGQATS